MTCAIVIPHLNFNSELLTGNECAVHCFPKKRKMVFLGGHQGSVSGHESPHTYTQKDTSQAICDGWSLIQYIYSSFGQSTVKSI